MKRVINLVKKTLTWAIPWWKYTRVARLTTTYYYTERTHRITGVVQRREYILDDWRDYP